MNNISLLKMYKLEKAALDFPSDPFPSFKQWKEEYIADFKDLTQTVDIETAVAESDKIVEEAEKELEQWMSKKTSNRPASAKKVIKVSDLPKPKIVKKIKSSKTHQAEAVYRSMMVNGAHPNRADVITRFVQEIGLSPAGASTYHHNIKKKMG